MVAEGKKLRSLGVELYFLSLGVKVLLGTSLVAALLKALTPGTIGPEDGLQLVNVTLTTAPLTAGFAAAFYLYLAWRERPFHPFGLLVGWTLIALISLFVAGAIGDLDAENGASPSPDQPDFHPLVAIIGVTLAGYLSAYGTGMFASALLIGGYAGWKSYGTLNREGKTTPSQ